MYPIDLRFAPTTTPLDAVLSNLRHWGEEALYDAFCLLVDELGRERVEDEVIGCADRLELETAVANLRAQLRPEWGSMAYNEALSEGAIYLQD